MPPGQSKDSRGPHPSQTIPWTSSVHPDLPADKREGTNIAFVRKVLLADGTVE